MSLHHGQVVEKVIRRDGYSISQVARMMNINRRTIYNWFNQPVLRQEIIHKIGMNIMHDFSIEFPHFFNPEDFVFDLKPSFSVAEYRKQTPAEETPDDGSAWREKYIALNSRYIKLLDHMCRHEHALKVGNQ